MYQWLIAAAASVVALVVSALAGYENYNSGASGPPRAMIMKWVAILSVSVSALVALLASMAELGYPLV